MSARKVSKRSVNYRRAPIWALRRRCALCSMFREPASCTLVAGRIDGNDVCDEWERKR
jgi:hypothetical protein